ncbi:MAG: hypothetical protein V4525_10775 [Pseudomonadota bacterium]
MGIINTIKLWFNENQKTQHQPQQSFDIENFIYIKIPGNIQPIERGELFEEKIDAALSLNKLGAVSGGGSLLSDPDPNGNRTVESCGIDIDATDRNLALIALRELLPQINTPLGTELHYTRSNVKLQDMLTANGWQLEQLRTYMHPGFGI